MRLFRNLIKNIKSVSPRAEGTDSLPVNSVPIPDPCCGWRHNREAKGQEEPHTQTESLRGEEQQEAMCTSDPELKETACSGVPLS